MNIKRNNLYSPLLLAAVVLFYSVSAFAVTGYHGGGGKGNNQNTPALKAGDSYRMFINNLNFPLDKQGVIADVDIKDGVIPSKGGSIDGNVFLFSGGFFLSGLTNGSLWTNAVASASRIQDYVAGTVASGKNDSRAQIYVLKSAEGDFAPSWTEWKDAVALGAYYYDGDGDGVYNPVDKNGNGKWDVTEDRPDLIGDETAWCVYNDGTDPALRRFNDVSPQGIEIRQSVFAFNSKSFVGNMIFIRYSLLNTGTVADVMDSVYFGVWADPDLGDYNDDLVGCDTTINAGFVYNDGDDATFGSNPPCFLMDFFQGPVSYIPGETFIDANGNGSYDAGETALDTAYNVQGQVRGVQKYVGAKNMGLSGFIHYMQSHATHGDPNTRFEARNYMLGRNRVGEILDPCTWSFGIVDNSTDCHAVNPLYSYSGDPVTGKGWINNTPTDQRQMSITGPFKLEKDKSVDVVIAYVVGRGVSAKNSVTVAKDYDKVAQLMFDSNFPSPPAPPAVKPTMVSGTDAEGTGFIDIDIPTSDLFSYVAQDSVLGINRRVQGIYINQYNANSVENTINGINNVKEVANLALADSMKNIYTLMANGNKNLTRTVAESGSLLDSATMANATKGRVRVRLTKDAFTDDPFIKGKPYFFTITTYTLNHEVIFNKDIFEKTGVKKYGPSGDYLAPVGGYEEYQTKLYTVTFDENMYSPAIAGGTGKSNSVNSGSVGYTVVNYNQLTGNNYSVDFFTDTVHTSTYSAYYKLRNTTSGVALIDSSKSFDTLKTNIAGTVTEGFLVKVASVTPALGTPAYSKTSKWYDAFSSTNACGAFYGGSDIADATTYQFIKVPTPTRSTAVNASNLRKVKLVFGDDSYGKAYRYLQGFKGSALTLHKSAVYGASIALAADTTGKGPVGLLGQGFVNVPFRAYVDDPKYPNDHRRLAVGFVELSATQKDASGKYYKGTPDGKWTPTDSLLTSGEMIVIFNSEYDETGSQMELTGGDFAGTKVWADLFGGFTPPATSTLSYEKTKIAKSKMLNSLYVVGLQQKDATSLYAAGDTLTINVDTYPYATGDNFTFSTLAKGALTTESKKNIYEKVNVFPNPLFAYNPYTSLTNGNVDEPYVTFSNLPAEVSVKIYSLSGLLLRTLTTADKTSVNSPFLKWDLKNTDGLRVASGMYLAIVSSPEFGDKVLKFGVIMPQKQIKQF